MKVDHTPTLGLRRSPHFSTIRWIADVGRSTLRRMRRPVPNRLLAVRRVVLSVAFGIVPLVGCTAGAVASTTGAVASTTGAVASTTGAVVSTGTAFVPPPLVDPAPPLVGSAAPAPVTVSSQLPADDAVAGLHRIQSAVDECLQRPDRCDVDAIAVTGSPAYRYLVSLRRYYLAHALVLRRVPELSYVVTEYVRLVSPDRAEITLCEVDGSWQMDSRRTRRTDDDIVWDDSIVSRRARHTLVRVDGVWKRSDIVELQLWLGEQRCPAPATV